MDLEGQEGSCSCFESGQLGGCWYHNFSREVGCGGSVLGERVRRVLHVGSVVMSGCSRGDAQRGGVNMRLEGRFGGRTRVASSGLPAWRL